MKLERWNLINFTQAWLRCTCVSLSFSIIFTRKKQLTWHVGIHSRVAVPFHKIFVQYSTSFLICELHKRGSVAHCLSVCLLHLITCLSADTRGKGWWIKFFDPLSDPRYQIFHIHFHYSPRNKDLHRRNLSRLCFCLLVPLSMFLD